MDERMISAILIAFSLILLAFLFFASWLAADPSAYLPPWLENALGLANVVDGGMISGIVGGVVDLFGGGENGGGLPIDLGSIDALRTVVNAIQNEGNLSAWTLFQQSFISIGIKLGLVAVALTAFVSFIGGVLALLNSAEWAQLMGWIGAAVGGVATVLLVITMPQLLRLGASNDIGMAIITAVFNVQLGYGFWLGLPSVIVLTLLNLLLAVKPPVPSSRRRPRSRTTYRYR